MLTRHRAFSLAELLVVLALLASMVALLLPAVQAARESSRRVICQNNLKQLFSSLAVHVATLKHYPYGGWGHEWVGVPGRGSGLRQPGGWAFSVLPFMESQELHDLGLNTASGARDDDYSRRLRTPLPTFVCPSRRASAAWEVASSYRYAGNPRPYGHTSRVARSDYAVNGGSSHALSFPGPATIEEGDDPLWWKDRTYVGEFTGISHLRTAAPLNTFEDGFSKTYLLGEKMLNPTMYETGLSLGDNDSLYSGFSNDLHRYTGLASDPQPFLPPHVDGIEEGVKGFFRFGSAHIDGFNVTYCDGAIRFVAYSVDPEVHFRAGHRRDGGADIATLR